MDRNLDLGMMAELLFTEIVIMSFFMPWLSQAHSVVNTIYSTDISFCQLLQIFHSDNAIIRAVSLNSGWLYALYFPLLMAMINIYALIFRRMQGLSMCTGCAVFTWLVVCIQYKWHITHDTMIVSTGFYLALMSSICLTVISLLRFIKDPREYKNSIYTSSVFIVFLSGSLWCIVEQFNH